MANFCAECGADLRGVAEDHCPTCGTARRARSWLARLIGWFRGASVTRIRVGTQLGDGVFPAGTGALGESERVIISERSTTTTLDNLDDLPAEIRAQVEAALRGEGGAHTRYSFTDNSGTTYHFDSLDDMPPHIRSRFDDAQRRTSSDQPPPLGE
jgi:hypothetical protein